MHKTVIGAAKEEKKDDESLERGQNSSYFTIRNSPQKNGIHFAKLIRMCVRHHSLGHIVPLNGFDPMYFHSAFFKELKKLYYFRKT